MSLNIHEQIYTPENQQVVFLSVLKQFRLTMRWGQENQVKFEEEIEQDGVPSADHKTLSDFLRFRYWKKRRLKYFWWKFLIKELNLLIKNWIQNKCRSLQLVIIQKNWLKSISTFRGIHTTKLNFFAHSFIQTDRFQESSFYVFIILSLVRTKETEAYKFYNTPECAMHFVRYQMFFLRCVWCMYCIMHYSQRTKIGESCRVRSFQ